VLVPAAEGVEDGPVQVFERLVAPDLDGARDDRVLPGEFLGDRPTEEEDLQGIEPNAVLVGRFVKPHR
jgi:hypothetical protein